MNIREARADDVAQMLAIYTPYVTDTTVSFEIDVPTPEAFARRVADYQKRFAWLVAEDAGRVLGYAYGSPHRGRAAYRFACEVSVYVDTGVQRGGVGRELYTALFERLRQAGYYRAYGGIALPNDASVAFHTALGFEPVGVYRKIGFKLGAWRDVAWFGLSLREGDPD